MNTTFEAQLRSQTTFIMALLESRHPCDRLHRGHVPCLEEIRRVSLNGERLGLELYGLAESVICSDGDRQVSVRALLDELEAQLPIDPNASSEQLEHDYADAVVSLAGKLGPISGEALLFCARVEASRVASERYDEDNDTLILELNGPRCLRKSNIAIGYASMISARLGLVMNIASIRSS